MNSSKKGFLLGLLTIMVIGLICLYLPVQQIQQSFPKHMVFAHRGVTINAIENTDAAFRAADSLGFSALEVDVEQTKEGRLIIFHDKHLNRLIGKDKSLDEIDFNELQALASESPLEEVLSLKQFFHTFGKQFMIYLDIKSTKGNVADSLVQLIHAFELEKQVIVADADIFFLASIKKRDRTIATALEGFGADKSWLPSILPARLKPDFYAGYLRKMDEATMASLEEAGLSDSYIAYEVHKSNLETAKKIGVKHIIFDYEEHMPHPHELLTP